MWALYGHTSETYTSRSDDTVVARFTTEQDALAYIRASELASPTRDRRYRVGSLLHGYDDASVEWEDHFEVPVDPKL